jgi:hypothetical protein
MIKKIVMTGIFKIISNDPYGERKILEGLVFENELLRKLDEYRKIFSDRPDVNIFAVADIDIIEE